MSPTSEFTIISYTLPDGTSDDFNFNISFDQPVTKEFAQLLFQIPGIDNMAPAGRYTLAVSIGRCFDPQLVQILIREAIKKRPTGSVLSLPNKNLVVPK